MKPTASRHPLFFMLPLADGRGLRLFGELDISTVGELEGVLDTLPERAHVLDLAELSFMDASGLHALEQYAGMLDGDAPLVLQNVSAPIRRLFQITGVDLDPDIELRNGADRG